MTVGIQQNWFGLNNEAGQVAINVRAAFDGVQNISDFLNTLQDSDLEAMGGGSNDIAVLRAAIGNLATLAQIYQGISTEFALPFNFEANTYPLWGGR